MKVYLNRLANSNRFKGGVITIILLIANDVFQLGVSPDTAAWAAGIVISIILGSSHRKTPD